MKHFFETEAEAAEFAAAKSGTITGIETESFLLPPEFWAQLETSPAAFAVTIRAHADNNYNGNLESAWNDALDGEIRGLQAGPLNALDAQFRAPVVSTRWMVEFEEVQPVVEIVYGSSSADAGEPGNEDGAWGSSSYDGWLVD